MAFLYIFKSVIIVVCQTYYYETGVILPFTHTPRSRGDRSERIARTAHTRGNRSPISLVFRAWVHPPEPLSARRDDPLHSPLRIGKNNVAHLAEALTVGEVDDLFAVQFRKTCFHALLYAAARKNVPFREIHRNPGNPGKLPDIFFARSSGCDMHGKRSIFSLHCMSLPSAYSSSADIRSSASAAEVPPSARNRIKTTAGEILRLPFIYEISFRMVPMAFFSRRETCACEMPTSAEISVCVFPS